MKFFAGLLFVASLQAWAQAEVSGFVAAASVSDGNGTHASFGAGAGVFFGPHLQYFGEYSRIALASRNWTVPGYGRIDQNSRFDNLTGGFKIRFLPGKAVQPFVAAWGGVGWMTASMSIPGNDHSYKDGYIGAGGGARIFAAANWGVRLEYRWQQYLHDLWWGGGNYVVHSVAVGPFFQFGGR